LDIKLILVQLVKACWAYRTIVTCCILLKGVKWLVAQNISANHRIQTCTYKVYFKYDYHSSEPPQNTNKIENMLSWCLYFSHDFSKTPVVLHGKVNKGDIQHIISGCKHKITLFKTILIMLQRRTRYQHESKLFNINALNMNGQHVGTVENFPVTELHTLRI